MNSLHQVFRDKIELKLDIVLRPDPGAADGNNICRLCNPDLKTYSKLCTKLLEDLDEYDGVKGSSATAHWQVLCINTCTKDDVG